MQDTSSAAGHRWPDGAYSTDERDPVVRGATWSEALKEPPVDTPLVVLIPYLGEISGRNEPVTGDR